MKAIWNEQVIAESDETILIEGNHYFPPQSVKDEYLVDSQKTSVCPWKGTASYYSLRVGEDTNRNAAWVYPQPKEAAQEIAGYIAFWKGVQVRE